MARRDGAGRLEIIGGGGDLQLGDGEVAVLIVVIDVVPVAALAEDGDVRSGGELRELGGVRLRAGAHGALRRGDGADTDGALPAKTDVASRDASTATARTTDRIFLLGVFMWCFLSRSCRGDYLPDSARSSQIQPTSIAA